MLAAAVCAIGGEELTRPFVTNIQSMAVTFIIQGLAEKPDDF